MWCRYDVEYRIGRINPPSCVKIETELGSKGKKQRVISRDTRPEDVVTFADEPPFYHSML
jgi:hypothetical protein